MSGRNQALHGKRRPNSRKPGRKPNASRLRVLAKRRREENARVARAEARARKAALDAAKQA
jgi:hypothetical protein